MNRTKDNAHRLAVTLWQYSEDKNTIARLAAILHYEPEQLQKDMSDIYNYIRECEESNNE
nr:MAG TPA: hypothetical protein [Caudoviricetes sp.]